MKILLFPISLLYSFVIRIKNYIYDNSLIKQYCSEKYVISIGNIIVGGTGKTPMTIYICREIVKRGISVGIISRGYKRKSKGCVIVSDGKKILTNTLSAGDEPYMIASKVNTVPVIVDSNRKRAIKIMNKNFNCDIIILDDAFQHRKVKRDKDIVLLNTYDDKHSYHLLPYGLLREPITSLQRADMIIHTYAVKSKKINNFNNNIPNYYSEMKYEIKKYTNQCFINSSIPKDAIFAFCGIAKPKIFFNVLEMMNINIISTKRFTDHINYSLRDIDELKNNIKKLNVTSIITTEKDLVKLPITFIDQFDVYVLCMDVYFQNKKQIIDNILCDLYIN